MFKRLGEYLQSDLKKLYFQRNLTPAGSEWQNGKIVTIKLGKMTLQVASSDYYGGALCLYQICAGIKELDKTEFVKHMMSQADVGEALDSNIAEGLRELSSIFVSEDLVLMNAHHFVYCDTHSLSICLPETPQSKISKCFLHYTCDDQGVYTRASFDNSNFVDARRKFRLAKNLTRG